MSDSVYDTAGTTSTSLHASRKLDSHGTPATTVSGITPLPFTALLPNFPVQLKKGNPLPSMIATPRNPTRASSSLGAVSLGGDEARGQMKCDLQDKICLLRKSDDFWGKILKTDAVPASVVTNISEAIRKHIKTIAKLSEEEQMYAPLASIFEVIRSSNYEGSKVTRFWTDHHTRYPGVDQDVFIAGLEQDEDESASTNASYSEELVELRPRKKRKLTAIKYAPTLSRDTADDNEGVSTETEDEDDPFYASTGNSHGKRKAPRKHSSFDGITDFRKPDWILLDSDSAGTAPNSPLWRQIAVIMELKISPSNAPNNPKPTSSLVVQVAEYARLHLALRPFQRFSIYFSLCKTRFTAWLIDRVGVIISDTVNITTPTGIETFIRALVQVTTHLTAYDLGMDPTVSIMGNGAMGDATIPQFRVNMSSENVYMTIGTPIWQSSSLFGRGTTVWNVQEHDGEQNNPSAHDSCVTYILKNSYRNSRRIAESAFYEGIESLEITGLAVFKEGGDVKLPETSHSVDRDTRIPSQEFLTNTVHRKGLAESVESDSITHRLVLMSRGRRLSEYTSVLEVLQAVLESVKGHEILYQNGILHRDISIGNVFISADTTSSRGVAGFLGDLDMAKVYDPSKLSEVIGVEKVNHLVKGSSSGGVTGTAQFMALPLLLQALLEQSGPDLPEAKVVPRKKGRFLGDSPPVPLTLSEWDVAARNDLESFIWVIIFAFCLREMNSRPNTKNIGGRSWYLENRFLPVFGAVSFAETYGKHSTFASVVRSEDPKAPKMRNSYFSHETVWNLLQDLMTLADKRILDHAMFKKALEFYIAEEQEDVDAQLKEADVEQTS